MEKKYRIDQNDIKLIEGVTLYRIIAEDDIPEVVFAGEKGGYIASEDNLSREGTCWITEKAMVMGNSVVSGDALILGTSIVKNSSISGRSEIYDSNVTDSVVRGNADIRYTKIIGCFIGTDARINGQLGLDFMYNMIVCKKSDTSIPRDSVEDLVGWMEKLPDLERKKLFSEIFRLSGD